MTAYFLLCKMGTAPCDRAAPRGLLPLATAQHEALSWIGDSGVSFFGFFASAVSPEGEAAGSMGRRIAAIGSTGIAPCCLLR